MVAVIEPFDKGVAHANLSTVRLTVCPQPAFNETTVRAMTIQLVILVMKEFDIVLDCGDEKRAEFGNKLETCVDKNDVLLVKFCLLFIILIFLF